MPRRAWGEDVAFHTATVQSNVDAGQGMHLIFLVVPEEVSAAYQRAGQFVQVRPHSASKPSFFAIASPPGVDGALQLLIKEVESSKWLTQAGDGDVAEVSAAMGNGFDMSCEAWASSDVHQINLFATGTGLAPIRAALECGALQGKVCRLYLGARSEEALAFADSHEEWRRQGIEVIPVLSQPDESWQGRRGYVQDAFREDEERGEGFVLSARHGALLCGQRGMVEAVREIYAELGVPAERTLLNF